MARLSFDGAYKGTPPWDIGRPQGEVERAAKAGEVRGRILDAGCGTGEHALLLASLGCRVLGIDAAPTAIEKAREKARARRVAAEFRVFDALELPRLGEAFDGVVDTGLFHVFTDRERPRYTSGLAAAVRKGGSYHVLCFSDQEPGDWGPRRVRKDELRAAFAKGWRFEYVREATFETNLSPAGARAWFARLVRR